MLVYPSMQGYPQYTWVPYWGDWGMCPSVRGYPSILRWSNILGHPSIPGYPVNRGTTVYWGDQCIGVAQYLGAPQYAGVPQYTGLSEYRDTPVFWANQNRDQKLQPSIQWCPIIYWVIRI